MKPTRLLLLVSIHIFLGLGCSEPTNIHDIGDSEMFTTNRVIPLSGYQEAQAMQLTWQKEKAIIHRTSPSQADPSLPSNAFFIRTNNVRVDENGRLDLKPSRTPVWFVPFENGSDPINLSTGPKCIRYWCNCDGAPSSVLNSQCYTNTDASTGIVRCFTQEGQSCPGGEDRYCVGSAAYVPCEGYDPDQYYYDTYYGGLILEAMEVEIIEPAGFKKTSNNTLDFIMIDGKGLYVRDEYERFMSNQSGKQ